MFAVTVTAHADITVAMREQITEEEGPVDANRDLYQGFNNTIITGHKRAPKADFGQTNWGLMRLVTEMPQRCCSPGCSADQASGRSGVMALAKLMQKAGEDFAILGDQENAAGCMLMTLDSGASMSVCNKKTRPRSPRPGCGGW